jgi:hypothetical protein
MNEESKYYESKVYCVQDGYLFTLVKKLNEFFAGKWVVATTVFEPKSEKDAWKALVYYKIPINNK